LILTPCLYVIVGVRVTLRLEVYLQSVRLGDKLLENHDQYFFSLNTWGHSSYITCSLTRGWVCRLQLLLVLASAVILRSKSSGTHDHVFLSRIRQFLKLEGQVPVCIFPGTGCPSYTLRHRVPFSSAPTSRWATVELCNRAFTRAPCLYFEVKVKVTL
jgi:hypothetical protein